LPQQRDMFITEHNRRPRLSQLRERLFDRTRSAG
jgi:hypothetical protein